MSELTYKMIKDRMESAAQGITPELPTTGTYKVWDEFYDTLEDFDIYYAVNKEVDSWDWCIYTHYGMKIIDLLTQDELNQAEATWHEFDGPDCIDESFGVYEFASKVAYFALLNLLNEAVNDIIEELKDMATSKMSELNQRDNMG